MSNELSKKNGVEIIPAIIPKNYEDLRKKVSLVKDSAYFIQIDITDGEFVPSISWPITDSFWESGIHLELPFCEACDFELDLMVKNPEKNIQDWLDMKAKRIIVHVESTDKIKELLDLLKGKVSIGVAFNIETKIAPYFYLFDKVDFIQLMGIEKIGFQGQEFSEKVFDKIKEVREIDKNITISIDGGVNLGNAQRLIDAGVNRLVSGSAIFEGGDIKGTINEFKKLS